MARKINVAFIGLGNRGVGLMDTLLDYIKDVNVVAVCDEYTDRVEKSVKTVKEKSGLAAKGFTDYRQVLALDEVEAVIISASWEAHIPLAIESMKAGKIVGLEVGGAYSINDCYKLVEVQEQTKVPLMFLENCCFGRYELTVTNLVRKGKFGEIVFCHGAYSHDLRHEVCGGAKNRHYRLRNYMTRNCDNYPTHNLGPIAKLLNINRGNRMLSLSSIASKSVGLEDYVKRTGEYKELEGVDFKQGDVVLTHITCADGSVISLKLSTSIMQPYSREFTVSGTKGMFSENGRILVTEDTMDSGHKIFSYENRFANFEKDYTPSCWKQYDNGQVTDVHGGIDYITLQCFFDCIRTGEEFPIDVYDAAAWMSISCLSEASITQGGAVMEIPDFTGGKWLLREPKDVIDFSKE